MGSVDSELLEDIRCAREGVDLFNALDAPADFWQLFLVANRMREAFRLEIARLRDERAAGRTCAVSEPILNKVQDVRRYMGPLIEDFRQFVAAIPDAPDGERLEMSIGFMAISPKALETLGKWLFDPPQYVEEGATRMAAVGGIVDGYREALSEAAPTSDPNLAAPPEPEVDRPPEPEPEKHTGTFIVYASPLASGPTATPVEAKASFAPTATEAIALPHGVDPEILDNIRCITECREHLSQGHPDAEFWELLCLVMKERDATKSALSELRRLKTDGQTDTLTQQVDALFGMLQPFRSEHGEFVKKVREFVMSLPIGHFGQETWDMAVAFIVAAPRGRKRAQDWLADPERYKHEAMDRVEDVLRLTMSYQVALRMTAP